MVDAQKIFVDSSQSSKFYFYRKPIQNSQKTIEKFSDIEETEFYFLKQVFCISLIVPINFRFGFAETDLWRLVYSFLTLWLQFIQQICTLGSDCMDLPTRFPQGEIGRSENFILHCIQLTFFFEIPLLTKVVNIKC